MSDESNLPIEKRIIAFPSPGTVAAYHNRLVRFLEGDNRFEAALQLTAIWLQGQMAIKVKRIPEGWGEDND